MDESEKWKRKPRRDPSNPPRSNLPSIADNQKQQPTLWQLKGDMDELFDSFFERGFEPHIFRPFGRFARFPSIDLLDEGKSLVLRAQVPGFLKEDLEALVRDDSVTIIGRHRARGEENREGYYSREIMESDFQRSLALPVKVKPKEAIAKYLNGMLEIRIPKSNAQIRGEKRLKII